MVSWKFRHFFFNKHIVSKVAKHTYFLSYNYQYKTLWFRTYKVASSTIRIHFEKNTEEGMNIYSSEVGYIPAMFKDFTKFAFVREPGDRLLSAYRDKVLKQNYFNFSDRKYAKMQNLDYFLDWLEDQDIDSCDGHIRSQHSVIDLNNIDFLGRFENFDQDYKALCEMIGMPTDNMKTLNKSKGKTIELSLKQRAKVEQIYEKDFQIFYPTL